nr:ferritin family protein [Paenibacillus sp.]
MAEQLGCKIHHRQILPKQNTDYVSLTGVQPTVQIAQDCPSEYIAGIHYAFKDEQQTVEFYSDAADQATDPHIKETFRRAATDEQRHAVWFLYYLTKHKPSSTVK